MNSELFTEVRVTPGDPLAIEVNDRWTLIPLPFVRSQEDSTNIGGYVIDSNFLGRGQLIVLGATFGSLGSTYFAMTHDPSVAFTDWTSRAVYLQDFGDILRYEGDVEIDGYHQKERNISLLPGYQFTPDLEGRALLSYTTRDYEEAESFGTVPEDYRFWTAGLAVELDKSDFRFYFRKGHRVELQIRHQFARSGEGDPTLSGQIEWDWQRPLPGRNVLKVRCDLMGVNSDAPVDSFQLGGEKSLRGVQEKGLWAQYLAGAVVDYHLPLREGRFGTWAAGPFVSYALYKPAAGGGETGWEDTFSYGLGIFYYLKKVAFPGIGITAGRNGDFSGNFVAFQIGFGQ
jgi:outer membrane protein assembly factor BamA